MKIECLLSFIEYLLCARSGARHFHIILTIPGEVGQIIFILLMR